MWALQNSLLKFFTLFFFTLKVLRPIFLFCSRSTYENFFLSLSFDFLLSRPCFLLKREMAARTPGGKKSRSILHIFPRTSHAHENLIWFSINRICHCSEKLPCGVVTCDCESLLAFLSPKMKKLAGSRAG